MTTQSTALAQHETSSLDRSDQAQLVTFAPPVDVYENKDEILLVADLPGVPKDALSVRLDRSELLIEGAQAAGHGWDHAHLVAFARTFRVPDTVDPEGISAELAHGVLRVHLAKSETAKPKHIRIQGA